MEGDKWESQGGMTMKRRGNRRGNEENKMRLTRKKIIINEEKMQSGEKWENDRKRGK